MIFLIIIFILFSKFQDISRASTKWKAKKQKKHKTYFYNRVEGCVTMQKGVIYRSVGPSVGRWVGLCWMVDSSPIALETNTISFCAIFKYNFYCLNYK